MEDLLKVNCIDLGGHTYKYDAFTLIYRPKIARVDLYFGTRYTDTFHNYRELREFLDLDFEDDVV